MLDLRTFQQAEETGTSTDLESLAIRKMLCSMAERAFFDACEIRTHGKGSNGKQLKLVFRHSLPRDRYNIASGSRPSNWEILRARQLLLSKEIDAIFENFGMDAGMFDRIRETMRNTVKAKLEQAKP